MAGSGALLAGTHNVTLLMTAAVLPLIVLALLPFTSGGMERAVVLARLGRGAIATVLGAGLTAAWLVPNLWLGPKTFISQVTMSQEGFVATAPFVRVSNVLSPWPVVPSEFKDVMWIYAQGPVLAIAWVLVALAITLVASRRGGGVSRGVVASSVALVVLGIALLELITHPTWWPSLPRLVQTVQMPMRLLPFVAIITAVAVAVLVAGIGRQRARRPLMAALVVAVAAQALIAIYVVTSGEPGVAMTATPVRHDDVTAEGEPSPFSGPGEIVPAQFRVLNKPQGDQRVVGEVATRAGLPADLRCGDAEGTASVGDRLATDIVASPLVRFAGDVRVAGRTAKGLTLVEVTRTDAGGVFTATVQAQCALCLSTAGSSAWQLRVGRLITLLSFALLADRVRSSAWARGTPAPRDVSSADAHRVPLDEQLPVSGDAQPGQAPGFCEQKSLKPPESVVLVPVEVPGCRRSVPPVPVPVWLGLVPPVAAPLLGAAGVAAPVPLLDDDEEDDDELLGVVDEGVLLEASSCRRRRGVVRGRRGAADRRARGRDQRLRLLRDHVVRRAAAAAGRQADGGEEHQGDCRGATAHGWKLVGRRDGSAEGVHAAPARGAVVEVLLRQLVAPVAEAEVLDREGQPRRARRQRDDLADDLEGLAGVAVAVDLAELGLEEDLAPRGGGAHAVALLQAHGRKPSEDGRQTRRERA